MSKIPSVDAILRTSSKATVSGIIDDKLSGDRIVPESRRADGSVRKERKIRPGYVPPEEVEKFKSARQLDAERSARPKGVVPGMSARAVAQAVASANIGSGVAAGRGTKKTAKKREEEDAVPEAPPDDWDAEEPVAPPKNIPPPEPPKELDPEKRAKNLSKKLRQAESLRERKDAGEVLLPEQAEKVASIPSLEAELAKLAL